MKKLINITIGADPEIFFERNGKIVSAEGLVGGTKTAPLPLPKIGCFVQEDNVMAEFNIPPCAISLDFLSNINYVKKHLEKIASITNATLSMKTSGHLDPQFLETEQAKLFGCDPDYNVYRQEVNDPIIPDSTFRSCGGHLHVGWTNSDLTTAEIVVKALDLFLGVYSVILDKDKDRRTTYGKAGSFRLKSYGVEYRTLSNFWIQSNSTIKWAFKAIHQAIAAINNGSIHNLLSKYSDQAVNIIDNSDVSGAKKLYIELQVAINNKQKETKTIVTK